MRHMNDAGVDLFLENGCGKTLAGFNKRIGRSAPTAGIEKIEDLAALETMLKGEGI